MPLLWYASALLLYSKAAFRSSFRNFSFHFDGAHCGNVCWSEGRVLFLDWEKVSYRDDYTFTLVRFATSIDEEKGEISELMMDSLIDYYLSVCPDTLPHFRELAWARLLERQFSDLVWVAYIYAKKIKDARKRGLTAKVLPVSAVANIATRYRHLKSLLHLVCGRLFA